MAQTSVYLREKTMRSGRTFLYLQYYPAIRNPRTKKKISWEPLHLQVFNPPANKTEKDSNRTNRELANSILIKRRYQLCAEEYDLFDPYKKEASVIDYFKELSISKKNSKWIISCGHFEKFMHGSCAFKELNENLCEEFQEYLLTTTDTKHGVKLHKNSAAAYYSIFKSMLKQAWKEKWLKENLSDKLDSIRTIKTHKEFLTIEEVKALSMTYCEDDVVKRAALFSCFTGLRISDILNLKWENIIRNQFGGYSLQLNTQKNDKLAENPLSPEALEFCGPKGVGLVFKGLERANVYKYLPSLIEDAGIDKHITFHCFRHTYATLQIAAGTDIYTVSKMLTHSSVQTTQIYADLVSEKKLETISKISIKDVDPDGIVEHRGPGRPRKLK
jgi:Site-specific recombinase XerD